MAEQNLIKIDSLFDLSVTLNAADNIEYILGTGLLTVMGKIRALSGAAFLNDEDRGCVPVVRKGRLAIEHLPAHEISAFTAAAPPAGGELDSSGVALVAPLRVKDQLKACFVFGNNITRQPWTQEEREYAALVGTITAGALTNALNRQTLREAIRRSERKSQLLTTLFEISREFNTLLNTDEIIRLLGFRLMGQLTISRFALLRFEEDGSAEIIVERLKSPLHNDDISLASQIKHPSTTENLPEELQSHAKNLGAAFFAPVLLPNNSSGMLIAGAKLNKQSFEEEDAGFLEALTSIVLTAIENARLFKEEIEKKRMEEELTIATTIQRQLLPGKLPHLPLYDVAAMNISSRQVGGDYYDVIALSSTSYLFAIADVSGKGTPAALLMANTQAALRTLASLHLRPAEIVTRLNDLLYHNTASDKFVTFFLAVLDTTTGAVTYVNAGHNPPLLLRKDSSLELLSEGGMLLGIMETIIPYQEVTIQLQTGDTLLLFTDGVTEALDKDGTEFSDQKLIELLRLHAHETTEVILDEILHAIRRHSHGVPQTDDITMIAITKKGDT